MIFDLQVPKNLFQANKWITIIKKKIEQSTCFDVRF